VPETATQPPFLAEVVAELEAKQVTRKLFDQDGSAWSDDPSEQKEISGWLGWLPVVGEMQGRVEDLRRFAGEIAAEGVEHIALLGMGGSSLAPIVLGDVFAAAPGYPRLLVLDTTDPEAIRRADQSIDPSRSLFIVSSKSGGTIEPNVLADYFWERCGRDGNRFVAITDAGTTLSELAAAQGYRRVFINRADIGGRYSALSYFGLVPAALIGIDIARLLSSAAEAVSVARQELSEANDGAWLGAQLGAFAREGRDKVTFVTAPELSSLGLWLEQLIAESTGKRGTGLLPIAGEELGEPTVYGDDRLFVSIELEGQSLQDAARLHALTAVGYPLITRRLGNPYALGAEFVNWEVATPVAGSALGINPFDQPNVQESKDNTARLLADLESSGVLPAAGNSITLGSPATDAVEALKALFGAFRPGGYIALMAYLAHTPHSHLQIERLRLLIRDRTGAATTFGYGPRYLHSTGQFHKGGPQTGVFLQLLAKSEDLRIPGRNFTFGQLKSAQALGDLQALQSRNRPVLAVDLGSSIENGLEELTTLAETALGV
jgi:glucose-6-phosphate isomerase